MASTPPPPGIPAIMLIGYALLWSIVALLILALAKRKGRSRWVALFGFIPVFNAFYVLWLVSQTDKQVLDRLAALEQRASLPPRI